MLHSIDAEKAFDETQHPFLSKNLQKIRIHDLYKNLILVTYGKPTASVMPNLVKITPPTPTI